MASVKQTKTFFMLRIGEWFKEYLITQALLFAVSLPFLITAGLPLSIGSFLGNLLFLPFITAFLFISSLFFICTLFGYAPWILKILLEFVGSTWFYLLQYGSPTWLIRIPYSSTIIIILYSFILIYASITNRWYRWYKNPKQMLLLISGLIFIALGSLTVAHHPTAMIKKKIIILPKKENKISVYDKGFLSKAGSVMNTVHYEFASELTRRYGSCSIDTYYCFSLSQKQCQGLAELLSLFPIQTIIFPRVTQEKPKKFWYHYYALKKKALELGTKIIHSKDVRKTFDTIEGSSPSRKTRYTA